MKNIIIILILSINISLFSQIDSPYKSEIDTSSLNYVREAYYHAVEFPESVDILLDYIKNKYSERTNRYNPIIMSYHACLTGLKGKYDKNVYNKVKYVNQGISRIDSAAGIFPECFEIRFLRFSFYYHLPDFFNVKEKRKADLDYVTQMLLKKDYSFVPRKIQIDMINFIIASDKISDDLRIKLIKASL